MSALDRTLTAMSHLPDYGGSLFGPFVPVGHVATFLDENHYLGRATRGTAWSDEYGVLVLANPTSRWLPSDWLELTRWCLVGTKNGGSQQWKQVARWLRTQEITTVVSYSDPSAGHTGALYKACNWIWAPTWHRLRPPPSGNGSWTTKRESVKDRWIFPLRPDPRRERVLRIEDDTLRPLHLASEYRDPKRFRKPAFDEEQKPPKHGAGVPYGRDQTRFDEDDDA